MACKERVISALSLSLCLLQVPMVMDPQAEILRSHSAVPLSNQSIPFIMSRYSSSRWHSGCGSGCRIQKDVHKEIRDFQDWI
jgi:hypothetical protein